MSPKTIKLLEIFCMSELGKPLESNQPVTLGGYDALEYLWPLHDRFKPRQEQIKTVRYREQFETAADEAIEALLMKNDDWSALPLVVWRVLLERYQQSIILCVTNAYGSNSNFMHFPSGLSDAAKTKFAVAFLCYAMKLPYKVTDGSQLDIDSPFDHLKTQLQ